VYGKLSFILFSISHKALFVFICRTRGQPEGGGEGIF
jgi:hypothetical protein